MKVMLKLMFNNVWEIGDSTLDLDDEHHCNAKLNNRENGEDVGYRRLVEQAEQELYPKSFKTIFHVALA